MTLQRDALGRMFEMIGNDPIVMSELVTSFLEETPPLVEAMRKGTSTANWDIVGRAAHTMKSTARDFGVLDLAHLCETLEADCRSGLPAGVDQRIDAIDRALAVSNVQLTEFRAKLGQRTLTLDE